MMTVVFRVTSDKGRKSVRGMTNRLRSRAGLAMALFLLAATGLSADAAADEQDTARWGGDYKIFRLNGGARACERACEKDWSCRAWTFIRPASQCRLKYTVPPPADNPCCVSGVKRVADSGPETQERRCAAFANRAIEQQEQNLAERCGYTGPLWHLNYGRHYRRCLSLGPAERRAERVERRDALKACIQYADRSRRLECDHYARLAVAQSRTNQDNACGLTGRRWSGRYQRHFDWCMGAQRAVRWDEAARREAGLARCLAGFAGPRNQACADFARILVKQFRKNEKYRCGRSGPHWHGDEARHYLWCTQNSPAARERVMRRHRKAIKKCKSVGRALKFIFKF